MTGFMGAHDYRSTIERCRLSDGTVWPMPIVLTMKAKPLVGNEWLLHEQDGAAVASIEVTSVFRPTLEAECLGVYGTTDRNHPGVAYLQDLYSGDVWCVGGTVTPLNGGPKATHHDFVGYRMTPAELKEMFQHLGWTKIIGFQTRNPMHRCHMQLVINALNEVKTQFPGETVGALIHPTLGPTQHSDIAYPTRMRCYMALLESGAFSAHEGVELGALPLAMRMAGPREALWHALIRRNSGCTHFIMGRDPAGPSTLATDGSKFYGPYDAHELVELVKEEIGITIVTSQMLAYVPRVGRYLPLDEVGNEESEHLSGTELRRRLRNGEQIPEWFTEPLVANVLRTEARDSAQGCCFYLVGLSGAGKCLAPETPVASFEGGVKLARDVKVDDFVLGDDNSPRRVLAVCEGRDEMYSIKPKFGDSFTVNSHHILSLRCPHHPNLCYSKEQYKVTWTEKTGWKSKSFNVYSYGEQEARRLALSVKKEHAFMVDTFDMSVKDFLAQSKSWQGRCQLFHVGFEWKAMDVALDPYIYGIWLGDGHTGRSRFTNVDEPIVECLKQFASNHHLTFKEYGPMSYHLGGEKGVECNYLINRLKEMGCFNKKFICPAYLTNSREVRLKLLAGLIDTDGYLSKGRTFEITQKSERLAEDIAFLCRSLGFATNIRATTKSCIYKDEKRTGTYHRVTFWGDGIIGLNDYIRLKRKTVTRTTVTRIRNTRVTPNVSHFKIIPEGEGPYCGFTVNGNGRFLLGDFTVTHNSTLARALADKLREIVPARRITVLDGDEIRRNISAGLGFSKEDRSRNVRRIGYVASLLVKTGGIVLCANIAPYREDREWNRREIEKYGTYHEIHVATPLNVCEERDVKGLYQRARSGEIAQFTGISDPFEDVVDADLALDTSIKSIEECLVELMRLWK